MTTKHRSMLLAMMTLVLCLALVAGGTYALFSDQVKLTNHLEAGKLDITLKRIKLEKTELDSVTGYMEQRPVDYSIVDFSNKTTENVFGIAEGALIVPCSTYTATMQITNNSNVAFGYWIEIKLNLPNGITQEELANFDLDKQISIYFNGEKQTVSRDQGLKIGGEGNFLGKLAKAAEIDGSGNLSHPLKSSENFEVSIVFENLTNAENNLAQGENLNLDLIVHAVQLTEEAPTLTTP